MRLIATEEAFATPEYFEEYLKLAAALDTPSTRYLKMYYRGALVRQLSDFEVRLADMDANGVDMQLLSFTAPGVQAFDAELGSDMAQRANEHLASAIRAHPTRFAGLGTVAPQSPSRAAREVRRVMADLHLSGIIINSHTQGEFLDDEKFWPIFEAAVAHDAPIYLHPNFPADSMIEPYARYGMMGALWGFAAECSLHVVRLILAGVFDQFPKLQIVLGHLGEGLPFWLGRLDNRYANILRRGGLEPLGMKRLARLPSEYFRSNFHVTTSGMNTHPPLEFVLRMLGAERVLFAVDYPFEQSAEATACIHSAPLSPDVMRKITHENAEQLFKLPR
ncbi:MAG TPA: amidohydrolase family protein [Steroidobacteraceae bacterium]